MPNRRETLNQLTEANSKLKTQLSSMNSQLESLRDKLQEAEKLRRAQESNAHQSKVECQQHDWLIKEQE